MNVDCSRQTTSPAKRGFVFLARRAVSILVFGALFCTLAVKLYYALRQDCVERYIGWIAADIAVLLAIEVILVFVCFAWPRRWVIRAATIVAAIICTWAVMNAGWLIRTGTQILPMVLLPLFRDPLNALGIIGGNLAKMPLAAIALLGPSAVALGFFFAVLAGPLPPVYTRRQFDRRMLVSAGIVFVAVVVHVVFGKTAVSHIADQELRSSAHLRAITTLVLRRSTRLEKFDLAEAKRTIPTFDQVEPASSPKGNNADHNIVIVVLEGIQYNYTSLADKQSDLTPHLAAVARQGVQFSNTRSTLTHTTKVLFALLTGRYPSFSQDLAEAVPIERPYAGLPTILKRQRDFRTAFFQSAKGNFETRPGLVHNLGFDKFWARDDLNDANTFVGSLGSDEFAMLPPIADWLRADHKPFLLVVLCSVTHDPYVVPEWYGKPADDPVERYKQTIRYTDRFIEALDGQIAQSNLADKTIFCVIGDHGEAFGEHGLLGHERIGFDEALRVPWVIRAPSLAKSPAKVTTPVSSIDLTPTLLGLLGFETDSARFDGCDILANPSPHRSVYFAGWLEQSPSGFVRGGQKFIFYPTNNTIFQYDLNSDPLEVNGVEPAEKESQTISEAILRWRKDSIFRINQQPTGEMVLFDLWLCRWNDRVTRKCTRM